MGKSSKVLLFSVCFLVFIGANIVLLANSSAADRSYTLPITRDGKTETMVAYNFWSSEYPNPVINVNARTKGKTKIKAYKTLRELDTPVECTIENGLYHPWGKGKSLVSFYTITPLVTYTAKRDVEVKANTIAGTDVVLKLKAGDTLTREAYMSEGYCMVTALLNGKETEVETSCDSYNGAGDFDSTFGGGLAEQWLYLKCAEGHKAFVQDSALLAQPGIKEGKITDFGSVAP